MNFQNCFYMRRITKRFEDAALPDFWDGDVDDHKENDWYNHERIEYAINEVKHSCFIINDENNNIYFLKYSAYNKNQPFRKQTQLLW